MAIVLPPPETVIVTPEQSDAFRRLLQESIEEYAEAEAAAQRRAAKVNLANGTQVSVAGGFAAAYALLIAAAAAPLIEALVDALTDTDTDVDIQRRRRRKTYKCAATILSIIDAVQTDSAVFSRHRALETKPEERRKARTFRSRA